MALCEFSKELIEAVTENDIRRAKRAALSLLATDNTIKNKPFVNRYKNILTSAGSGMVEMSGNLQGILTCKDVSLTFKENRYFLNDTNRKIADSIFKLNKVSSKLMEMMIPYKNATLLYGNPGTGKTLFGEYIAYKLNIPFVYLDFSKVVDSLLGMTSRNVANAFAFASSNPCVFMLDEIDTISVNRSNVVGAEKEFSRVTVTLMQEFDKLANDVIVIAATNRLDMLDKAFVSRCSNVFEMPAFTETENKEMIRLFLSDIGMEIDEADINDIIQRSKGSQREIMTEVVKKIADKLLAEEDI